MISSGSISGQPELTLVANSTEDFFDFVAYIDPTCQLFDQKYITQLTISEEVPSLSRSLQSTFPPPRYPQCPAYLHIAQSLSSLDYGQV